MTKFAKARWSAEGDALHLGMDFSKVDKQRRMVAGWATLDNVDTENDVVTAEASADAFARSRRNLREMHKKDSAVGRIVSFKEDTFRAPDGNTYRGIFVKVRVSEGAEDTWKKVLDGTLSGFSIGGSIIEAEEEFNKDAGTTIRKVTKYDLTELSLVDNPGNQYSDITNVFKIRKSADGSVTALTGMVEEHTILNVFYCNNDEITKESPEDNYECPVCSDPMTSIGFVEDGSARDEKVSTLVTKYLSGEGGVTMAKAQNNKGVDGDKNVSQEGGGNPVDYVNDDQAALADPTGPEDEVGAENVEEVADEETAVEDVEEVQDDEDVIAKQIEGLQKSIKEILDNNNTETTEKIEALEKTIKETREFFDSKISEVDNRLATLDTNLEATKSRLSGFEKSLDKINSGGAFRKSADSDESTVTVQKSDTTWNGAFSVDNLS